MSVLTTHEFTTKTRKKKNGGDGEKSSSGQHASSLYSIHYCCYRLETADNVAGWHVVDVSFKCLFFRFPVYRQQTHIHTPLSRESAQQA